MKSVKEGCVMSRSVGSAIRKALAAIPFVWATVAQAQEFKGPIWGSSGGTSSYNLDCGSTGVMVGVYGKTGLWIDQVGITCRKVNSDGRLGSSYTKGPYGGTGGSGKETRCESGKVVGAMRSWTGSYVGGVAMYCYSWSASTRRPVYDDYATSQSFLGNGSSTSTQNAKVTCPPEKVAKALRGKYGWYIDSVQFVCDDYNK